MGASWRPFDSRGAKHAMTAEDHNQEVQEAARYSERQNRWFGGRLGGFLDDRGEIERQGDRAVHHSRHHDPPLTE